MKNAQSCLEAARQQDRLAAGLKPKRTERHFFIPITAKLTGVPGIVTEMDFEPITPRGGVKTILGDKDVGRSFDLVGDIAVIEDKGDAANRALAKAIMALHKRVKTVAAKGATEGTYRIRPLRVVAGEKKTATIHKENSCAFEVDLNKAYFSTRLSFERERIAKLCKDGERVLALFAGVGPFPIVIAKKHHGTEIAAIEHNPDAAAAMQRNAKRNKVRLEVICADCHAALTEPRFKEWADRVLMTAPHNAKDFLAEAIACAKPGGVIHYYSFASPAGGAEALEKDFTAACRRAKRRFKALGARQVSTFSAGKSQWVLDAQVL